MKKQQKFKKFFELFSRKAQMEIIGLMLIVIIGALVMVFAISFQVNQGEPELVSERFSEMELSSSFATVMSQLYVPDCDTDYSTLVRDCASVYSPGTAVTGQGNIQCTLGNSCEYVQEVAEQILGETLDVWGTKYRYRILKENLPGPIYQKNTSCGDNDAKEAPGRQIIPLYPLPEQAFIVLEVCK